MPDLAQGSNQAFFRFSARSHNALPGSFDNFVRLAGACPYAFSLTSVQKLTLCVGKITFTSPTKNDVLFVGPQMLQSLFSVDLNSDDKFPDVVQVQLRKPSFWGDSVVAEETVERELLVGNDGVPIPNIDGPVADSKYYLALTSRRRFRTKVWAKSDKFFLLNGAHNRENSN